MRGGNYLVDSANTRDVAAPSRADFWTGVVNSYHCRMSYDYLGHADFHGSSIRQRTDSYQLVMWRAAKDRLRSPAYQCQTITGIAYRLGFSSTSAFSTACRERFGCSPSELRDG